MLLNSILDRAGLGITAGKSMTARIAGSKIGRRYQNLSPRRKKMVIGAGAVAGAGYFGNAKAGQSKGGPAMSEKNQNNMFLRRMRSSARDGLGSNSLGGYA